MISLCVTWNRRCVELFSSVSASKTRGDRTQGVPARLRRAGPGILDREGAVRRSVDSRNQLDGHRVQVPLANVGVQAARQQTVDQRRSPSGGDAAHAEDRCDRAKANTAAVRFQLSLDKRGVPPKRKSAFHSKPRRKNPPEVRAT